MTNPKHTEPLQTFQETIARLPSKITQFLTKKRHIYKPYIEFYLDIGFIRLRTSVMHRAYERDVYDYIRLDWKLFKWNGGFNLYKPGVDLR